MKSYCSFLLILFSIGVKSYAQNAVINLDTTSSTPYYADCSDSLTIRAFTQNKYISVEFKDKFTGSKVVYDPNNSTNIGFGFNYKWVGLNVSFSPLSQRRRDKYGETTSLDLQGNFYGKKVGADITYQKYKGFYWRNPHNIFPSYSVNEKGYVKRRDLESTVLGVSAFYVFNHDRFSYRSSFTQNQRQLKSAGSMLLGGYFNKVDFGTPDSAFILPQSALPYFHHSLYAKYLRAYNLGIHFGYIYTYVLKEKFFVTAGLGLGLGFERTERVYENGTNEVKQRVLNNFGLGRFGIGYNGPIYYFGVIAKVNNLLVGRNKEYNVHYNQSVVNVMLVRRFSARFLRKNNL